MTTTVSIFYEESYIELATESLGLVVLVFLLQIQHSGREMQRRIEFNRHVMLSVEGKKNKEVAAKLMPIQALSALQQEESFVTTIKNGTILMFNLNGF